MFVRFRQTSRSLQLSLVAPRRANGKVRQEHVAGLGSLPLPPDLNDRAVFWKRLLERLERLANRLDDETRNKIVNDVLARVSLPTDEERRDQFEREEAAWKAFHGHITATVEENEIRRQDAEKKIAAAEPVAALAQRVLQRIEEQRARMERGEGLPPIGSIPTVKDLGFTAAHTAHAATLAALPEEQFERFLNFGRRPTDLRRREYALLRRFLRAEKRNAGQPP
jgi:hypothetical protein